MSIPVTERLADLEWLLDGGVWPPNAARRCGWTVHAAEKAARRHGVRRVATAMYPHMRGEAA